MKLTPHTHPQKKNRVRLLDSRPVGFDGCLESRNYG